MHITSKLGEDGKKVPRRGHCIILMPGVAHLRLHFYPAKACGMEFQWVFFLTSFCRLGLALTLQRKEGRKMESLVLSGCEKSLVIFRRRKNRKL